MTTKLANAQDLSQGKNDDKKIAGFPAEKKRGPALAPRTPDGLTRSDVRIASGLAFDNVQAVVFLAANPGEGCTTAALSMAASLARDFEARTLLMDGNLRQPTLHSHFGLPMGPGLGDLLCEPDLKPEQVVRPTMSGYDVMTAGGCRGAARRLASPSFASLLATLKDSYDYVLCDMFPFNSYPEAAAIARAFDGVALVLECEKTRWQVAQSVKERLEMAGANVIGAILNKRKYYIPKSVYERI